MSSNKAAILPSPERTRLTPAAARDHERRNALYRIKAARRNVVLQARCFLAGAAELEDLEVAVEDLEQAEAYHADLVDTGLGWVPRGRR